MYSIHSNIFVSYKFIKFSYLYTTQRNKLPNIYSLHPKCYIISYHDKILIMGNVLLMNASIFPFMVLFRHKGRISQSLSLLVGNLIIISFKSKTLDSQGDEKPT